MTDEMISLTCTHCKAVLTIDDAFAGGACRCQHCGTIQTVPTKLKGSGKLSAVGAKASGKALYRNKARDGAAGTGLDDLADAVLSSGLSSHHLVRRRPRSRARFLLVFVGCISLILILSSLVVFLAMRESTVRAEHASASSSEAPTVPTEPGDASSSDRSRALAPQIKSPNFCGVPLQGETVIYVLDRGDSTRDMFGDLMEACFRSIATLGPQRKFQVIFWNNGSDDSYPSGSPSFATKSNLDAARSTLEEIAPHGKTDIAPAFKKAINASPCTIVIATAKAWDLDDAFVTSIQNMRGGCSAQIHTIALSDPGTSTALKRVAANNSGQFKFVSESELKDFGR